MNKSVHKTVLLRLFLVWLMLTPMAGGLVAYLEFDQVDQRVLALVLREASAIDQMLVDQIAEGGGSVNEQFQRRANALVEQHFVVVDVYDDKQDHLATAARYSGAAVQDALNERHHQFPLDRQFHYEKLKLEGDWYVQVLLPLFSSGDVLVGYFEGVYRVDSASLEHIESQIYRAVFLIILVVSVTTSALYPIILYLNRQLIQFSKDIFQANVDLMRVMGTSISKRDRTTDEHNYRVTLYAVKMGELLGLDAEEMRHLISGSFLHDVGKIGVPDAILCKEERLDEEEMAQMQQHVAIGLDIVKSAKWLEGASDVIQYHHEKFDGSGYLKGLKGRDIPLNARIFAIVDVFDALMSSRPYKEACKLQEAVTILEHGSGTHFDPGLLALFLLHAPAFYKSIGHARYLELTRRLTLETRKYFFDVPIRNHKSPKSPQAN